MFIEVNTCCFPLKNIESMNSKATLILFYCICEAIVCVTYKKLAVIPYVAHWQTEFVNLFWSQTSILRKYRSFTAIIQFSLLYLPFHNLPLHCVSIELRLLGLC